MTQPLHWLVPAPPKAAEIFEVYQATHEFYREAQYREALEEYYEWYEQTAAAHQREAEKMRRDVNIFGWFSRRDR